MRMISIASFVYLDLRFQNGNPAESINGISNEALLAIVLDRLEGFQAGPYPCRQNEAALAGIRFAMLALHDRARDRGARDVEGTSAV